MTARLYDLADGTYAPVTAPLNFSITENGQAISATTSSAVHSIDPTGSSEDVLIYNPGPNTVYVRAGTGGTVATSASMPIVEGEKGSFYKAASTHLAVLSANGTQAIWVKVGTGA